MPIITENNLQTAIKAQAFNNIYLLYGEEKYLIKVYTDKLKAAILGESYLDFNFQQFEATSAIDDIYDAVLALPVMSDRKLILVKDMDFSSLPVVEAEKLCELLTQVPEECTLVFSQLTSNVSLKQKAQAKKIFSVFSKNADVLELKKKSTTNLSDQLIRWAKKRNCQLSYKNADTIVEYSDGELLGLTNEMEKLCAYCKDREITKEDIDLVMVKSFTANVFELSKSICNHNYNRVYEQLNLLFYQKEEPVMIVAVLGSAFIDMYRVKSVEKDGKSTALLLNSFDYKNKEFRIRNASRQIRNLSYNQLGDIIDATLKTDIKLKSIRGNKRIMVEKLVAEIINISN